MKKHLLVGLLAATLCVMVIACNNKQDMSTRTKFPWVANVTAPRNYPVEVKYSFVGFGQGQKYPIMSSFANAGIGISKGEVSFADLDGEGLAMPNRLEVLWLSYTERKFYKADIAFSEKLQARILSLFQEGYENEQKHENYSCFLVTLLPGGKIWLYLNGIARYSLVCDTLQADTIDMALGDFDKDALLVDSTVEDYCKGNLNKEQVANLKENGVPYELWSKYQERFNYDIEFEFEDNLCKIDSFHFAKHFINGEFNYACDGVKVGEQSRPKQLYLKWNVADTTYTGEFFFDEQEVLDMFSKGFSHKTANIRGKFMVKVSKYNNRFDIYLQVGSRRIALTRTKIHVFRDTPLNLKEDEKPFYNNHRDVYSGDIHFIEE